MTKKQVKKYILSILLIFFILIVLYVVAFLIFLLPELMTDEAVPQSTEDNFKLYWRIVSFPLQYIRVIIPSRLLYWRYFDLILTILNLIVQAHIVYGMFKGIKHLLKRNKSEDKNNGVA
jgi:hypothetical protein